LQRFSGLSIRSLALRARLRSGTATTGIVSGLVTKGAAPRLGLASLLLLCAPTVAWAAGPCETSSPGTIVCDPGAAYPQGIHLDVDPSSAPQDLTLVIGPGYSIATSDDEAHGIAVNNPTGAITVTAGEGTISTTGSRAAGIRLTGTGPTGDLTVVAGDVSTSGYRSDGISVSTNYGGNGNVSISAGNVLTSGEASTGIRAAATYGSIRIDAGTVGTAGYGSDGVAANTYHGDIDINVGNVSTSGAAGRGIVAYAGGAVTVNAGSVSTTGWGYGPDSDAGGIKAVGSSVRVNAGTVETFGAYSAGIYANSNHVYDAGTTADHDIIVTAGEVRTQGAYSYGIVAINTHDGAKSVINSGTVSSSGIGIVGISRGEGGTVEINSGSVQTFDNFSYGIAAIGSGGVAVSAGSVYTQGVGATGILADANSGTINIDVDSVETRGIYADGIVASNHVVPPYGEPTPYIYGPVSIKARHVETTGVGAIGIAAQGAGVTVTLTGDLLTTGARAAGIFVDNRNDQQALVVNDGRIVTAGDKSDGIDVTGSGYGNNFVRGAGTIETLGDYSAGIRVGVNGPVTIDQSSIETRGFYADGVHAVVVSFYGMNLPVSPDLSINLEKVTTLGDYSNGVFAWHQTTGAKTQIHAGQISTSGYHAYGVFATGAKDSSITVDVDTVSTRGDHATGIGVEGDAITVTSTGAINTKGAGANGINLFSRGGDMAVDVNAVSTEGEGAIGIMANRLDGEGAIAIAARDVRTSGTGATGILGLVTGGVGDIAIGAGSVATIGDAAAGIQAISPKGDIHIVADKVTTQGQRADGIATVAVSGAIDVKAGTVATTGEAVKGINLISANGAAKLTAGTITGTGANNIGAAVVSYGGDTSMQVDRISLTGAGSVGIAARTIGGNLSVSSGTISTTGTAIDATSSGDVAITVRGATQSQGDAIVAAGSNVSLAIAAGGSVSGVNGVVVSAATYVPPVEGNARSAALEAAAADPMHRFTLTNAGLLEGGSGYALRVDDGTATITNSGTIKGRLLLGGGDDLLTNTGLFLATANSDFGTGNDRFVNQGTVRIGAVGAPAAAVTMLGLERFENAGGTIDLSNGHTGDMLMIPKDYVGSNGARVALDVGNGMADRLIIGGAATGSTAVVLADVSKANAVLTAGAPLALIQAGAGSSANAFTLAVSDVGLVHYNLNYDAATGNFLLSNAAGIPVYRLAKLNETLANAWSRGTDTVTTHLAGLRDGGSTQSALWGTFGGASERIRQNSSINGGGGTVGYRQDEIEARIGYDFGNGSAGRPGFGLTGGYTNSKVNFSGSAAHATADSFDIGGYARLTSGRFFANGSVSLAFHSLKLVDRALGYSDDLSGRSVGAQAEAGVRFGGAAFFLEPSARLSWSHTSVDDIAALSQTVSLDSLNSVRGTFGARLGGTAHLGSTQATFYGGVHYVHEFAGKGEATLFSSTASDTVEGLALPDQVRTSIGANIGGTGPVSGFVQADGAFGSGRRGAGGRIGIRFGF